jgi:hypothetical protein
MRAFALLLVASAFCAALAAPVPKEAEKLKPATDKEREEVKNNLKMIGLGFWNFESAYGHFVGDVTDPKTKKPLLSWRVHLLPYLEEDELYKQFKMDEPWDSENNKKLIEKMPKIFAPTRVKAKPGETYYRGFGDDGLFPRGQRVTVAGVTDGTSNTICVIDAGEPVIWTKPDTDIPVDPKVALPKLGAMIDDDFYCVMCDGSIRTIKRAIDEKVLRALISRAGGEVIADDAP